MLSLDRGTGRYVSVEEPIGALRTMFGVAPMTMLLLLRDAMEAGTLLVTDPYAGLGPGLLEAGLAPRP